MLLNPDAFIRDAKLTVWFSVPSVGVLMKRFGVLRPSRYAVAALEPVLRRAAAVGCGRAPGRRRRRSRSLENLYGPTELTVACSVYRWDPQRSPSESPARHRPDRPARSRDGGDGRRRPAARSAAGHGGRAPHDRAAADARLLA